MREVIVDLGGPKEATVVGSGMRTSCLNAALANGVMVRCLDYNDAVVMETETGERMGYHPSEVIPGILALGERAAPHRERDHRRHCPRLRSLVSFLGSCF